MLAIAIDDPFRILTSRSAHPRLLGLLLTSAIVGSSLLLTSTIVTMSNSSAEPLRGTIDLLLLRALALGPMHGWGITQRIQDVTSGVLEVNQGSLYPALQRLEQKEWIDSDWRVTDNNRRAKFYRLTAAGRRALGVETESWRRLVVAVEQLLSAT